MNTENFQLPEIERNRLVEQYQPYVRKIAGQIYRKLAAARYEFEELVAYGNLGLVEAAERYNPQRGIAFTTFSYYRIRGAIYDGLRQIGYQSFRTSELSNWEINSNELLQTAAEDEKSESSNVEDEIKSVGRLIENLIPAYFLSLEGEFAEELPSNEASAADELEKQDSLRFVLEIVQELPEQEQDLIKAIYFKQISTTQFAAEQGITKSWASRLHARAIERIRDKLKKIGFLSP